MDVLNNAKCAEMGKSCVCLNLRKASRMITQTYDESLRPSGLRVTQFGLMMVVKGVGKVTVTKLAKWATMERTTVTRNLKLLEKKGFVKIEPGEDQRERVVTLTDEGIQALNAALPFWEKAQQDIKEIFGEDRTSHVIKEVSKMTSILRNR